MQPYFLLRYPGCKWRKHLALMKEPSLIPYLPQTELLSQEHFFRFIRQFHTVFIKPIRGGGGKGIWKITKIGNQYLLRGNLKRKLYHNKHALYHDIKHICAKKRYIIQQGIDLMRIQNRPVDFRIVLLKYSDEWEYIGIMGKCAARNRFVTNHSRGGTSIHLKTALIRGFGFKDEEIEKTHEKLKKLSLLIAKTLNQTFENITELGLDIAIDNKQKIWLLEANTKPRFNLFKYHENKDLYKKIYKYTSELRSRP